MAVLPYLFHDIEGMQYFIFYNLFKRQKGRGARGKKRSYSSDLLVHSPKEGAEQG